MINLAACAVLIAEALLISKWQNTASPSSPTSDIRQIGQAILIYASDYGEQLPHATDVWDYARHLAEKSGLNDATIWTTDRDAANWDKRSSFSRVLDEEGRGTMASFRAMKPSWAVVLGQLTTEMPATTPIAWTRGLSPDGTWADHSPYGKQGGHIVFLGGNVVYFRDLAANGGALRRFDGTGTTSNILDALPPGVRIIEYVPTETEQRDWAKTKRAQARAQMIEKFVGVLVPALWLGVLIALGTQVRRVKYATHRFVTYIVLSVLLLVPIILR